MRYYNAIQAAHYIGCDPKTVRRMLKRGQLTATRTEKGWLAIPGGQVEYAKIKWEEDQAKFVRTGLPREALDKLSNDSLPTQHQDSIDSIRQLEDRVAQLEEKTSTQNERIASLEEMVSNESLDTLIQPVLVQTTENVSPSKVAQKRSVAQFENTIPDGWTLCSDFFESLNISGTSWRRWLTNSLAGDTFEFEERPIAGTNKRYRYFTPEQKEKALDILKRHGKLPDI